MYHKKATLGLTPVQRLGNQACNCKIDYSIDHRIRITNQNYKENTKETPLELPPNISYGDIGDRMWVTK